MLRVLLTVFTTMVFAPIGSANVPAIEPGISKELAEWRAAHYSNVRYKLNLILEKKSPVLKGNIEIRVNLKQEDPEGGSAGKLVPIVLDWRKIAGHEKLSKISDVSLNGKSTAPEEINEHLVFRSGVVRGENVIKLDFESPILKSGSAVTRYVDSEDGSEYIYSLFVPSDASTAFPVFDQPDLKARFKLSVTTGLGSVVTNTQAEQTISFGRAGGMTRFAETRPISTYVFAFAVGPFKSFNSTEFSDESIAFSGSASKLAATDSQGESLRLVKEPMKGINLFVRKSQAEKLKPHAEEVFRLNREAIKYLEEYFDYKFPFSKYDIVLIPEFPFGGMEHAGATFLRERSVIFPTEPTANNYIARASVILHEAAHQWFGDTVTMKWFDDLWLKEGFATFMAYKAMGEILPQYDAWKVFYERTKPGAYATDVTKGTVPIYQDIPNLNSAKSAYGNIVYQKAPSFLKQAEFYLGEEKFMTAVREFLKKYEYANAEWSDLVAAFEKSSGQKLDDWAAAWVRRRSLPIVRLKRTSYHSYSKLGQPHDTANIYSLEQKDALDEGGKWPLKVKVLLRFENGTQEIKEVDLLRQPKKQGFGKYWIDIQSNPNFRSQAPVFVFPNFDDKGYAIFLLDPRSRNYALRNIRTEKDPFLRSMMWGALWDSVRFGDLNPARYVDLAVRNIDVETDDTTIASILGRVRTATAYYLNDRDRERILPEIETLLIDRILKAKSTGQLLTYYRSYLGIARSDKARDFLVALSHGSDPDFRTVIGHVGGAVLLKKLVPLLKTKDRFDIATRLIAIGDPRGMKILTELEIKFSDDAAKRYAYAARAALATKENKAKFFRDFVSGKQISESWIEDAFRVWNHPSHDQLTLPYLNRALAELPTLKRDRKIFFVNGWLGAFIGGQRSKEALENVKRFLKNNPDLDTDLQRKILERMDGLERSVAIRKKFGKEKTER